MVLSIGVSLGLSGVTGKCGEWLELEWYWTDGATLFLKAPYVGEMSGNREAGKWYWTHDTPAQLQVITEKREQ